MGLNDRLTRLEREEGGERGWEPIPREDVHALDVLADLKRDGLFDDSTPIEEIERLMGGRGVTEPVARRFAEMMRELQDENASNRHGPRSWR